MKRINSQRFYKKIWKWYSVNASDLPWRKTKNPYHILLSEVMLQQTHIPRVLEKYPIFLNQFPSIKTLAGAPLASILAAWHGMGYNRRGLYLKQTAERIGERHGGRVPKTEHDLRALPGIGIYSARAIRCFAYGICEPFIETNIRRVIIHEFFHEQTNVSDGQIYAVLAKIQPKQNQRDWYYALMDYGREALKHIPNPNRKSKHYARQSPFEGSPRYIRAKIISYLLSNKKATAEELSLALKKEKCLVKLTAAMLTTALTGLEKDTLVQRRKKYFSII